jgi:hypothetical protein
MPTPLTLEQVYEQVDKSLFHRVFIIRDRLSFTGLDGFIAEIGSISGSVYFWFGTPSEPQLLEIQKAQRLLLIGE